jgi:hypothetical protein
MPDTKKKKRKRNFRHLASPKALTVGSAGQSTKNP